MAFTVHHQYLKLTFYNSSSWDGRACTHLREGLRSSPQPGKKGHDGAPGVTLTLLSALLAAMLGPHFQSKP